MQIKVSKEDLETALRVAEIGIASSGTDLSTHFLFRVKDKGVEILSYFQRICASVPLKCQFEGDEDEAFTIEGKRLTKWLGGVGDVAISLENVTASEVQVKSPRSTIHLPSLDPTKFPFWDQTFSEAKSILSLPAERMSSALGYAKNFISDKDTTRPEISQVEAMEGALWATDKKAVTLITVDGMKDATFRIHGKDVAGAIKFLGLKQTEDVEILEHDRAVFLRRGDGAVFGTSRPMAQFPKLNVAKDDDDQIRWTVNTEELLRGIQCLSAAAAWDSNKLRLSFDKGDNKVILAVESVSGKIDVYPIDCVEAEGTEELGDDGFWVDHNYISHIVGHFGGDTLQFGINKRGKGGYVRFRHEESNDVFLTVVVWRI